MMRRLGVCAFAHFGLMVPVLALVGSCGDLADPGTTDVSDLQPVSEIQIIPGAERVTLVWEAGNNEDNFSGYNIYQLNSSTTPAAAITALELTQISNDDPHLYGGFAIDDDNRAQVSQLFNSAQTDEECQIEAKDVAEATTLCPIARCNVATTGGSGLCAAVTDDTEENTANGQVYFHVDGLTNGAEYMFFVVPTAKSGKKISTLTSRVVKARPRAVLTLDVSGETVALNTAYGTASGKYGVSLTDTPSGGKLTPVTITKAATDGNCTVTKSSGSGTPTIYFEAPTNEGKPGIVPANEAKVKYLGTMVDSSGNFDVTFDSTGSGFLANPRRLGGKALLKKLSGTDEEGVGIDGYNPCGKSRGLFPQSLYGISFPASTDATKTLYAILYTGAADLSDATLPTAANFEFVIGSTENDLRL